MELMEDVPQRKQINVEVWTSFRCGCICARMHMMAAGPYVKRLQ